MPDEEVHPGAHEHDDEHQHEGSFGSDPTHDEDADPEFDLNEGHEVDFESDFESDGPEAWHLETKDQLPAIWAAVDAVDAHMVELEEETRAWPVAGPVDNVAGAMEEVRDHLAAAFDVVRQLAGNLVPFAEQLEVLTTSSSQVGERISGVADVVEGRFARVEQGMSELADWIETRFETLEEAIGNDLDDLGDEVSGLAGIRPERSLAEPGEPAEPGESGETERPGGSYADVSGVVAMLDLMADRLDEVAEVLIARQDRLDAELGRLADEVTGYRRRVQVHARPPVVSEEQLDSLVARVIAGLTGVPAPPPEVAEPAPPSDPAVPPNAVPRKAAPKAAESPTAASKDVDEPDPWAEPDWDEPQAWDEQTEAPPANATDEQPAESPEPAPAPEETKRRRGRRRKE